MSYGAPNMPNRRPHRLRRWLLIGGGGVVALIVILIIVGTVAGNPSPAPKPSKAATGLVKLRYGQKATLSSGWTSDGIVSATVYPLKMAYTSTTESRPDSGDQYAVSVAQVCAGPQGADTSTAFLPLPFALLYPGHQTLGVLDQSDAAQEPDLHNLAVKVPADRCVRGYLTFQYTKGTTPLAVDWGSPDQPSYEWSVTGG